MTTSFFLRDTPHLDVIKATVDVLLFDLRLLP
jgi:hypothetical protein